MARRSKRRIAFQGGPNIWPSEEASLPLEHESVRRLERWAERELHARELLAAEDDRRVARMLALPAGGMGGTPIRVRRPKRVWEVERVRPRQFMPSRFSLHLARREVKRQDLLAFRKLPSLGKRTARCVGRIVRKQVMFALGKAGMRGIGRGKRWRRNSWSLYPC